MVVGYRVGAGLLGLSNSCGRPRCLPSVRAWGSTCTHDLLLRRRSMASRGELVQAKLTPSHDHVRSWIMALAGPVAVAYEAGPTGFGLYRSLSAAGIRCEVAAPSRLPKPSGDRVKTDARDCSRCGAPGSAVAAGRGHVGVDPDRRAGGCPRSGPGA